MVSISVQEGILLAGNDDNGPTKSTIRSSSRGKKESNGGHNCTLVSKIFPVWGSKPRTDVKLFGKQQRPAHYRRNVSLDSNGTTPTHVLSNSQSSIDHFVGDLFDFQDDCSNRDPDTYAVAISPVTATTASSGSPLSDGSPFSHERFEVDTENDDVPLLLPLDLNSVSRTKNEEDFWPDLSDSCAENDTSESERVEPVSDLFVNDAHDQIAFQQDDGTTCASSTPDRWMDSKNPVWIKTTHLSEDVSFDPVSGLFLSSVDTMY